ncbi:MAG: hypothetical protein U0414_17325 [Polyangiaceae bacterium]
MPELARSPFTALLALSVLVLGCGSKTEPTERSAAPNATATGKGGLLDRVLGSSKVAPDPSASPPGDTLVDDGFRTKRDGFTFENNGSEGPDPWLTAAEMREIFGDAKVCMQPMEGDACELTPMAEAWMKDKLQGMKDGVCEGMAVAALAFFKKTPDAMKISSSPGGKVELTPELKRLIGMLHVIQFTNPTQTNAEKVSEGSTPNDVLDQLKTLLAGDDMMSFGFYKRTGGGHAVVPTSIEAKGNDVFWLHIYDVNWPGVDRFIEFDRKKNTWRYDFAGLNAGEEADVWEGDAETHSLDYGLMSWRKTRECPFCADSDGMRELSLRGKGNLAVKDSAGHKIGLEDGKLVDTIPRAWARSPKAYRRGHAPPAPIVYVPADVPIEIEVEGAGGAEEDEDLSIFGMGVAVLVDDLKLSRGEQGHLVLEPDGQGIHFKPTSKESPVVKLAYDGAKEDLLFEIRDLDVDAGEELVVDLDPATGKLKIFDSGKAVDRYDLKMERWRGTKREEFIMNDVELDPGDADLVDFEAWAGEGHALTVEEDKGNDGTVDERESEADEPALK